MSRRLGNILVTGGCGFIGSNFIRYMLTQTSFSGHIINVDKLTYAGNKENLVDVEKQFTQDHYVFEQADISDCTRMQEIIQNYNVDTIVHFAAESHVDRSIVGPKEFIQTNIIGTFTLLDIVRKAWKDRTDVLFHHISTDEVYGSLPAKGFFFETTAYDPHSPYSASKAASDHLVKAYFHTYGLPVTISNCSNNYGPYQFPEKMIPLMIDCMIHEKELPIYGEGKNIRDWLFVDDHNSAVWTILQHGRSGETYNIGGENEWENKKLVELLCEKMAKIQGKEKQYYKKYITFVKDRPGHDERYAINCDKIKKELGWKAVVGFDEGLETTMQWYVGHQDWVTHIKTGEYTKWIEKNYGVRNEH